MTSIVDICNRALIRLGSQPIVSLVDNNDRARILTAVYDQCRQSLLRSHPWNFAQIQVSLPSVPIAPDFEYGYAYPLPADCLRVIRLWGSYSRYEVLGRVIYTNDSNVNLYYISNITDPNQFDTMFCEVFCLKLAKEIAYAITANTALVGTISQEYETKFREAKQYDSQEDMPQQFDDGTWLDSRYAYNSDEPSI